MFHGHGLTEPPWIEQVDLSALLCPDMSELNGWYHVVDGEGRGQGAIKVQVSCASDIPRRWPGGKKLALPAANPLHPARPIPCAFCRCGGEARLTWSS
jgi:hypothetical protein